MAASALQPSSGPCNTVSRRRFVFQPPLDGGPLPFHGLGGVGFGVSLCCIAGFLRWTKIQLQFGKCRFYGHGERLATFCLFSEDWKFCSADLLRGACQLSIPLPSQEVGERLGIPSSGEDRMDHRPGATSSLLTSHLLFSSTAKTVTT